MATVEFDDVRKRLAVAGWSTRVATMTPTDTAGECETGFWATDA